MRVRRFCGAYCINREVYEMGRVASLMSAIRFMWMIRHVGSDEDAA